MKARLRDARFLLLLIVTVGLVSLYHYATRTVYGSRILVELRSGDSARL